MSQFASQWIGDIYNATLPEFDSRFTESQELQNHVFARVFVREAARGVDGMQHEHYLRYKEQGDLVSHVPFKGHQPGAVDNVLLKWINPVRIFMHNWSWDDYESVFQGSETTKKVDALQARESAHIAGIYKKIDGLVMDRPYSSTDLESVNGIPYHIRMNTNSSGVPQALAKPDFKGIYLAGGWKDGSTTNISDYFGLDRASATYSRLNNVCGTYSGSYDEPMADSVRWIRMLMNFDIIPGLKGDASGIPKGTSPYKVIASQTMAIAIEKAVNAGPDDYQGEIDRFLKPMFQGMEVMPSATLNSFSYSPIYFLDTRNIYSIYPSQVGRSKALPVERGINGRVTTNTAWTAYHINIDCEVPRHAGAVLHTVAA